MPPREKVKGHAPDDHRVRVFTSRSTVSRVALVPIERLIGPRRPSWITLGAALAYDIRRLTGVCKSGIAQGKGLRPLSKSGGVLGHEVNDIRESDG